MKIPSLLAFACCWVLLAPASALAAASTTTPESPLGERTPLELPADAPQQLSTGGGSGSLARTFIGLAVVIAVIYAVAFVLKKMKASGEATASGDGLSSVATVPLGPGRSVHLIRAGRELVLVGSAEKGVVPIRTYTEAEATELGLLDEEQELRSAPSATLLANVVEQLKKRTAR